MKWCFCMTWWDVRSIISIAVNNFVFQLYCPNVPFCHFVKLVQKTKIIHYNWDDKIIHHNGGIIQLGERGVCSSGAGESGACAQTKFYWYLSTQSCNFTIDSTTPRRARPAQHPWLHWFIATTSHYSWTAYSTSSKYLVVLEFWDDDAVYLYNIVCAQILRKQNLFARPLCRYQTSEEFYFLYALI